MLSPLSRRKVGFNSFLIADMAFPGLYDALFNRLQEVSAFQPSAMSASVTLSGASLWFISAMPFATLIAKSSNDIIFLA